MTSVPGKIEELRNRLGEISDIASAIALLHWDQQTYMPKRGGPARGRQQATLAAMRHRLFISEEMRFLLEDLRDREDTLSPDDAALVKETAYEFDRSSRLPEEFVRKLTEEESSAFDAWLECKPKSDFESFRPHLETLLDLQKQKADYLGFEDSPYDPLLEDYERGMTAKEVASLFSSLAERQSRMVDQIINSPNQPDLDWTRRQWSSDGQWRFGMRILSDIGFDLEAGRLDRSEHPFSIGFDIDDVRITTRLHEKDLFSGLMSTLHEAGHGLYEQGYAKEDRRTLLAEAPSLGMHESQSRLWENMIGRSLPFWNHYAGALKEFFPNHLEGVDAERIYRAINHVGRSLIRVESDECTYNLHVILRFEIEKALMENQMKASEIPEAWNAKMMDSLGVEVPDHRRGCLQDVHWSSACFGYFPTYALGNLYAAQMFEKILQEIPDLWDAVEAGDFSPLLDWLRKHVHRHGRRKKARELILDITGREPDSGPYLRYLETKYGEMYDAALN